MPAWAPAPGDYDGDGKADFAWYEAAAAMWRLCPSAEHYAERAQRLPNGGANDVPAPADCDGDGKADRVLFRRTTGEVWARYSVEGEGDLVLAATGMSDWIPAMADYDGDGKADFAWFVPSAREWRVYASANRYAEQLPRVVIAGSAGVPVPADFDGDGKADMAMFVRETGGIWYRSSISGAIVSSGERDRKWLPAAADYDGDGRADFAWYDPVTQTWRVHESSRGHAERTRVKFGSANDWPLATPLLGW
jgi:hypothetical protein